ncbi:hypothetical protein QOT17_013770 [Balamuthia mandrillaris]
MSFGNDFAALRSSKAKNARHSSCAATTHTCGGLHSYGGTSRLGGMLHSKIERPPMSMWETHPEGKEGLGLACKAKKADQPQTG